MLAAKAAPPQPELADEGLFHMLGCGAAIVLFFVMAGVTTGAAVLWVPIIALVIVYLVGTGLSQQRVDERNKRVYEPAYERWKRTLMCLRCGEIKEPTD